MKITSPSAAHDALGGVSVNDHHNQAHTPESHTSQGATATELETLTDGSGADALHNHPVLLTKIQDESRTAAAASGDVSYTGAGFRPTGVIILASTTNESWCIGIGDVALDEAALKQDGGGSSHFISQISTIIVRGSELDGTDHQLAVLKSIDADGLTLTWTKGTDGRAVSFAIFYMR